MRVLLDVNVLLDSLLQRTPWNKEADDILSAAATGAAHMLGYHAVFGHAFLCGAQGGRHASRSRRRPQAPRGVQYPGYRQANPSRGRDRHAQCRRFRPLDCHRVGAGGVAETPRRRRSAARLRRPLIAYRRFEGSSCRDWYSTPLLRCAGRWVEQASNSAQRRNRRADLISSSRNGAARFSLAPEPAKADERDASCRSGSECPAVRPVRRHVPDTDNLKRLAMYKVLGHQRISIVGEGKT